jgi:hypothetical protein
LLLLLLVVVCVMRARLDDMRMCVRDSLTVLPIGFSPEVFSSDDTHH